MEMEKLQAVKRFEVRFSEVDSMNVVWHGEYAKYLEDAREEFGRKFGLEYMRIYSNGCLAPIVRLTCDYKRPLLYGMRPEVTITYVPTDAAKIVFDYEIRDTESEELIASARSVQVFTDCSRNLLWTCPEFYEEWKRKWLGGKA